MTFAFPDGLAPSLYPIAWIVGRWRGAGIVEQPSDFRRRIGIELSLLHDASGHDVELQSFASPTDAPDGARGADVKLQSFASPTDAPRGARKAESPQPLEEARGAVGRQSDVLQQPVVRYAATWRLLPGTVADRIDLGAPDADFAPPTDDEFAAGELFAEETGYWRASSERLDGLSDDQHPIEAFIADASGRLTAFLGWAGSGRIELASQRVIRSATSPDVTGSHRMFGFVAGRVFFSEDVIAGGGPLRPYASGQLWRADDLVVPGAMA
jgi:hypothetical protein